MVGRLIDTQRPSRLFHPEVQVFVLSLLLGGLGYSIAGRSFGTILWIGALFPIIPLLVGRQSTADIWRTLLVSSLAGLACGVILPIGTVRQTVHTAAFVGALTFTLEGTSAALSRCLGPALARPLVVCFWAVWLTWPLWASHFQHAAGWTDVHPIFVLNSVWPELGDWSHQSIAYSTLTRFGQDEPLGLPMSPRLPLIVYLWIGCLGQMLAALGRRPATGTAECST